MDRKDLKIKALLDKISSLEEREADLRVDITILHSEVNRLTEEAKERDVPQEGTEEPSEEAD
jgi:hypothetical protein